MVNKTLFKKILVPIDGSKPSLRALEVAAGMATATEGSEVICLTVSQAQDVEINFSVPINISLTDTTHGNSTIAKAQAAIQDFTGKVKFRAMIGRPVDCILDCIKEQKCDCIVMGCRGLSGYDAVYLGSVSSAIAQQATCPVFILK